MKKLMKFLLIVILLLFSSCSNDCYKLRFSDYIKSNISWVLKVAHPSCSFKDVKIENDYKTFNISYVTLENETKNLILNFKTDYNYKQITNIAVISDNGTIKPFSVVNGLTSFIDLVKYADFLKLKDITAKELTIKILNKEWKDYRDNINCEMR